MIKRPWAVYLILALVLTACTNRNTLSDQSQVSKIKLASCQLSAPGISTRISAKCGALRVYENRAAASGRQIDLRIAVIPAISRSPQPDPLFFIAGGPGEAASESYLIVASAFQQINQHRDIILVDQRGTGQSHPLACGMTSQVEHNGTVGAGGQASITSTLRSCLAGLDADPRYYTTVIAMQDLEEVRQALGYGKINLYGVSYGTRAALSYMRQFPSSVRSAILDGVDPPNWSLGPETGPNAQRSLDLVFKRCSADQACDKEFPNLVADLQSLLHDLQQKPAPVQVTDPSTGEINIHPFTYDEFTNTIFTMTYAPETAAILPLLIHNARNHNDYQPLVALMLANSEQLTGRISDGMRYSVLCAEDIPYAVPSTGDPQGYLGDSFMQGFKQICSIWPRGEIPEDFKQPVQSDIPTLLLSGEADPVTPPANGDLAAKTLSHSLHLVTSGEGHINIYRGCIPNLASQFIETGSVHGLNTACVKDIQPLPLFINFAGPHP